MADIGDRAQEIQEQELAARLAERKPEGPQATGYCLSCGEKTEAPRRWCDARCRDLWEKINVD